MKSYDVVVVGCGGVGSAALYHLARRGAKVIGLDRFPPGHARGSSHGDTRIIRQAYFEHENYVPLALESYKLWADLEQRANLPLFAQVGLLQLGPAAGEVVTGVLNSARRHGLEVDQLTPTEVRQRFPALGIDDSMCGVLERAAGYLRVEACVQAHATGACQWGAELAIGPAVLRWEVQAGHVLVHTTHETYSAARLILSPGAWASTLLDDLGIPLKVVRKPLFWFPVSGERMRGDKGFPGFLYEMPDGVFYGFPEVTAGEVKLAEHSGGQAVTDPLKVERRLQPDDLPRIQEFLGRFLPDLQPTPLRYSVCLYTLSPDLHFILDRHPDYPQVSFAAGLSGHGFKFTPALGLALSQLALDGKSSLPIQFLHSQRVGLRPTP